MREGVISHSQNHTSLSLEKLTSQVSLIYLKTSRIVCKSYGIILILGGLKSTHEQNLSKFIHKTDNNNEILSVTEETETEKEAESKKLTRTKKTAVDLFEDMKGQTKIFSPNLNLKHNTSRHAKLSNLFKFWFIS